jgi:ABC-type polysaccharide/polyol phosphate transport system ATPase subunit
VSDSSTHPIQVRNLGKKFMLRTRGEATLKSTALDWVTGRRAARRDFWAVKEVSFSVEGGETLGIVGANGAGKSTLLALLAGTKQPTTGTVETRGKISSLLELGAGFHPELTGRENVYLAGAIMGLSRARMAERFESIVEFAELNEFIDQPVKHYSSGMYVRLGFAVAVEVDPDILLLDEVLAVGDVSFQRKCLERIGQFRNEGKTMLIISHDLETIKKVSHRILYLEKGGVQGLGEPEAIVDAYDSRSLSLQAAGLRREWGSGEVVIGRVEIRDVNGSPCEAFRFGDELTADIGFEAKEHITSPVFGFSIADSEGRLLYGNNTQLENFEIPFVEGSGSLRLRIGELRMAQGNYLVSFSVHSADHKTNYHRLDHHSPITVTADTAFEGCYMPLQWELDSRDAGDEM